MTPSAPCLWHSAYGAGHPFFHAGPTNSVARKKDGCELLPFALRRERDCWHPEKKNLSLFCYVRDLIARVLAFGDILLAQSFESKKRVHVIEINQPDLIVMIDDLNTRKRRNICSVSITTGWRRKPVRCGNCIYLLHSIPPISTFSASLIIGRNFIFVYNCTDRKQVQLILTISLMVFHIKVNG